MLPSRPRPNGLPSGPASRLTTRVGQHQPPSSYTAENTPASSNSSRHIRSQRSLASLTPPREPRSWTQPSSEFRRANSTRDHYPDTRYPRQSDGYSTSSEASSASSFLARMRGGRAGHESSRTSLEEDYEPPKLGRHADAKSLRRGEPRASDEGDPSPPEGEGHSLWNQVVTVANSLSVNVSKAWATNLPTFNGEETPPGQDSRLTRAMKAYHLDKARDPSDLPAWLFDEHERRPVGRSRFRDGHREDDRDENVAQTQSLTPKSRGLRDAYDASTSNSIRLQTERAPVSDLFGDGTRPVKTTNRLKELRDAKRKARTAPTRHDDAIDNVLGVEDGNFSARATMDVGRHPAPRVGLPLGPNMSGQRSRRL